MLIYGQSYGRLPYGRFSDSFFSFLEKNLSFSEKNKFRYFFMRQITFQSEKLVGRKKFKKQIGEIKKFYEKNFDREKFIK